MGGSDGWFDGGMLAFDLETTGVDRFDDVPVSFALVEVAAGRVVAHRASLVDPGRPIPAGATAVHGITTDRARREGMPLDDAVMLVSGALVDASCRGVPVVGMKLDFDLTMVDAGHRRSAGRGLVEEGFTAPVLDALVLDRHFDRYRKGRRTLVNLCAHYGVVIDRAHDASADARAALEVVLALGRRYPVLPGYGLPALHRAQVEWHRHWARSFDQWRRRQGLSPLDPRDAEWPIASPSERPLAEPLATAS